MDKATVFTKTAKGITQVNQKSASLNKDLMRVLKLIDGKSNFGQIMEKVDLDKLQLEKAFNSLTKDGFARVFVTRKEADPFGEEDDFDFTAPGKMGALPGTTQRVIPAAANDISELIKQQEKTEADKRSKEQAHEQARVKAKAEAEARANLEAEARARQVAEQQAMEQARRAKEASERARLELEAKLRDEEAKRRAMAEQQVRLSVEQKAKDEEEHRKLAELRVKAEREAKALAEARARAEAEAAAMARARAEADAAAKRKSQEANAAEAAMKARLKEEIEGRIRGEMEELLRNQAQEAQEKAREDAKREVQVQQKSQEEVQRAQEEEQRARAEMRAQIMAEARLAARAELEERLAEERQTIAVAEAEARTRAEKDATRRAEDESKKRAEAEARAASEAEARIRAEEETRRLRAQAEEQGRRAKELEARAMAEAEARVRDKAEVTARMESERQARDREKAEVSARLEAERQARAREQAEVAGRIDAERQGRYEAEARAKIEAEESDRRERQLSATIDAERKAKEEAELRARIEGRARETVEQDTRARVQAELEGDMTKRAELEGKAQAKAYMEAKARAEREEDERMRADQARKAREIADVLRTKVEPDEVAPESTPSARKRRARKGSVVKPVLVGLAAVVIIGIVLLHVVPLRPFAQKLEATMGAWIHDDVSIGSMTFRLLPTPHLKVDNIAVGKLLDAKAQTGNVYVDVGTLFGGRLAISEMDLDGVTISNDAAKRIPQWSSAAGRAEAGVIESIKLRGVKMDLKPVPESFDATLRFRKDGALSVAVLSSGGATVTLKPSDTGFDVDAAARNWTLPLGAPLPVNDVHMKGTWIGNEIVVPEFEADTMEGKVNGTLRITWDSAVHLQSDLSLARVDAQPLIGAFTKAISITGRLDGNFTLASDGPNLNQVFASPRVQGKFRLGEGSVSNVDLVAVMQSDTAGQRAGVTKFAELTGEMAAADGRASYRNLALQGGVLRGNGTVDVGQGGNLAGRLNLEIRSQVAQDRGSFTVAGTVQRPTIRRGG